MNWYWISYACDERFRGVVIIQANSSTEAMIASRMLGLSPGGQAIACAIPSDWAAAPFGYARRLLCKEECQAMMKLWNPADPECISIGDWEDESAS